MPILKIPLLLLVFALGSASRCIANPAGAAPSTPRVSAIYWGSLGPTEELRATARFDFTIVSLAGTQTNMQSVISTLRSSNPRMKIGTYTVLVEFWKQSTSSDRHNFPIFTAIQDNDWWIKDPSGQNVQWSEDYKTYLVNITQWAPKDSAGRRYPQWLAEYKASIYGDLSGLDYVFVDNVWYAPRPRSGSMDWERNGKSRANMDPQIQAAYRQGIRDYIDALRKAMPGKKIIGNADNDLGFAEFQNTLEGAYIECALGRKWSLESRGWAKMMDGYRKALANTVEPKDVILEACGEVAPDLRLMRYGLASALLEDGWFGYKINGVKTAFYADEYAAPIGNSLGPAPSAPTPSGIWMRRYDNGLVLVNPGAAAATIDVGPGYSRLKGSQDPIVNDGSAAIRVTVPPKDGLILLKR